MYTDPAFGITRIVIDDRVRAAEQHRLVTLARQARKARKAQDVAPTGARVRRPRLALRFGH